MFPSRHQHQKWSLPNKWTFWAGLIGVPAGTLSLLIGLIPFLSANTASEQRSRLLLQAAQELRYNDEWLASIAVAAETKDLPLKIGTLKTAGLSLLMEQHHKFIIEGGYGEEKHIYQKVLHLKELGIALGSPVTLAELESFTKRSKYTIQDLHFLSNFLLWYIAPKVVQEVRSQELYSLGRNGLPRAEFTTPGVPELTMKHFVHDGEPIRDYGLYLGLID